MHSLSRPKMHLHCPGECPWRRAEDEGLMKEEQHCSLVTSIEYFDLHAVSTANVTEEAPRADQEERVDRQSLTRFRESERKELMKRLRTELQKSEIAAILTQYRNCVHRLRNINAEIEFRGAGEANWEFGNWILFAV